MFIIELACFVVVIDALHPTGWAYVRAMCVRASDSQHDMDGTADDRVTPDIGIATEWLGGKTLDAVLDAIVLCVFTVTS